MGKTVEYNRLEAIVIARQYKSKTEFRLANKALYSYAIKRGWWHEMSKYMDGRSYPVKWTKKAIAAEAAKFSVKKEFQIKASGAYAAARKLGIVIEVCAHMERRLLAEESKHGRVCSKCGVFSEAKNITPNSSLCRPCYSKRTGEHIKKNSEKYAALTAKRRARIVRAIPPWVREKELQEIQKFYIEAKKTTKKTGVPHEVDHIFPLSGRRICGLHVPENLQVITAEHNRRKSNKMPSDV